MTENEIRINETTMWREWITVRGLEPITLQDIDDRLAELKQQVKVEPEVKPACEFTQEHFSIVGRAIEKWIKQDLVVEGKDMIGKKEGAKTLRERINEELSKSV